MLRAQWLSGRANSAESERRIADLARYGPNYDPSRCNCGRDHSDPSGICKTTCAARTVTAATALASALVLQS